MTKLGLGGHSFIAQLGNDPIPCPDEQRRILDVCIVDTVFVSMRRAEWVVANREAEEQGTLGANEA